MVWIILALTFHTKFVFPHTFTFVQITHIHLTASCPLHHTPYLTLPATCPAACDGGRPAPQLSSLSRGRGHARRCCHCESLDLLDILRQALALLPITAHFACLFAHHALFNTHFMSFHTLPRPRRTTSIHCSLYFHNG